MDPQIGMDILNRYYDYLQNNQPHLLVSLYRPGSLMARLENGEVTQRAYSISQIEALIMTWNFSSITYSGFCWPSWDYGVLVVAFGLLRRVGFRGRHKFAQTLFIAPSDNSFYICNDVLGFIDYIDDESSISTTLSPDITTDNDNDPISLNNVAESEITSRRVPTEFDDSANNNSHPSDESSTAVELGSLSSFPNSLANDMRSQASEISLDIDDVTLDQDQPQSNPEYVSTRTLPVAADTDLESLTTLANEMSIRLRPPTNGV